MGRRKAEHPKLHITATVDPYIIQAIKDYRNDSANIIDGEKPSKSSIVQMCVKVALDKYIEKNPLMPPSQPREITQ